MLTRTMVFAVLALFTPRVLHAQHDKLTRTEVVVLADLSNRIDARLHPGQLDRDTAIIRLISEEFAVVVKRNRYLFSRDRLRMLYVGGQGAPTEPRVDVAKMNEDHRIVVRELAQELSEFNAQAIRPFLAVRSRYDGADIWSWFRYSGQRALSASDPNRVTQTRIILITDGYLEFAPSIKRAPGTAMNLKPLRGRSDWQAVYATQKLASVGYKLPGTKVLVLELAPIHPERNTTEQDILEQYWRDWFASMGVESSFVSNQEGLASVRDAVKQFLAQ